MKRIKQGKGQKKDATLCRAVEEGLAEATFDQRPKGTERPSHEESGRKVFQAEEQQTQRPCSKSVPSECEKIEEARVAEHSKQWENERK